MATLCIGICLVLPIAACVDILLARWRVACCVVEKAKASAKHLQSELRPPVNPEAISDGVTPSASATTGTGCECGVARDDKLGIGIILG